MGIVFDSSERRSRLTRSLVSVKKPNFADDFEVSATERYDRNHPVADVGQLKKACWSISASFFIELTLKSAWL